MKIIKKNYLLVIVLSFFLIVNFQSDCLANELNFINHSISNSYNGACGIQTIDFDKDGDIDILSTAFNGDEITLWENDGNQNFTQIIIANNFDGATDIFPADIDGDGDYDIIATSYYGHKVSIFENTNSNDFIEHIIVSNFTNAATVHSIDMDNDGDYDIIAASEGKDEIIIFENIDDFNFNEIVVSNNCNGAYYVYPTDIDNDDDIDIISAATAGDEITFWKNDSDLNFTRVVIKENFDYAHWIDIVDMDDDGDDDIVATAVYADSIVWFENILDDNEFLEHTVASGFNGATSAVAADFDGDFDIDIAGTAEFSNKLSVFENDGSFGFTENVLMGGLSYAMVCHAADLDKDGDLDIVATALGNNKIYWFENSLNPNLLNNPESVVYDSVYDRYLVSNCGDGNIIQIDQLGNQNYFSTELSYTLGLQIVGDTLFAASNEGEYSGVTGFLLSTSEIVFQVDISEKELLNDITYDQAGNLFVTDCDANKIFKVQISDESYSTFVDSGVGYPNGILYDKPNNRLLVLNCLLPNRPISAVSLDNATVTTIVETGINSIDGLTVDNNGDFYLSSWTTDEIYRYNESFTNPPEIVSSGHTDPADIFYDKINNIMAIPNFNADTVEFVSIITNVNENIEDNKTKVGHLYPNPFSNQLNFDFYLPEKAFTTVCIYDVLGNKLRELVNKELSEGNHIVNWNGTAENGSYLKPGIYFVCLNYESYNQSFKIIKN